MLRKNARILGFPLNRVVVTSEKELPLKEMDQLGGRLFINYAPEETVVTVEDLSGFSGDDLEAAMEHEACHCMDEHEGIYGKECFYVGRRDEYLLAMCLEVALSHAEYHAASRQIKAFGKERFREFHLKDMQKFLDEQRRHLSMDLPPLQKALLVFAYFKEEVKSALIGDKSLPDAARAIAEPFPKAFDAMAGSGLGWNDVSPAVYAIFSHLITNISPFESYRRGLIVPSGRSFDVSTFLAENNAVSGKTWQLCAKVEDILRNAYRA